MRKKTLINKKEKKLIDKKCCFCGEENYNLLDVHRIIPGARYSPGNTLTICCRCHRMIHAKEITIVGKYLTSKGVYVVIFLDENKKEQIKEI